MMMLKQKTQYKILKLVFETRLPIVSHGPNGPGLKLVDDIEPKNLESATGPEYPRFGSIPVC